MIRIILSCCFLMVCSACSHNMSAKAEEDYDNYGPVLKKSAVKKETEFRCPEITDSDPGVFQPYSAVGASFRLEKDGIKVERSHEHGCQRR